MRRPSWSAREIDELIQARTDEFIAGHITETVYAASIFGLGKRRSEVDDIIREAKHRKHEKGIAS